MSAAAEATEPVLVIKHGAFGDVIQVMGAIADIRRHHPQARIDALTMPVYAPILQRCPAIDGVVPDPRAPLWKLGANHAVRKALRAGGYRRVYDLQNSDRTSFYRSFVLPQAAWCATPRRKRLPYIGAKRSSAPGLQRFVEQLSACGVSCVETLQPDISWMAVDMSVTLAEAGVTPGFVMLIPGSSAKHPQKRWPYYAELCRRLQAEGQQVVIAPGPDEPGIEAEIPATTLRGPRGFLNWFELAGLFRQAGFVVGNDTGPSHLAAHLGTPGLALFGNHTTAEKTGIVTRNFDAIEVQDLQDLPVAKVLERVETGLSARRVEPQPAQENSV